MKLYRTQAWRSDLSGEWINGWHATEAAACGQGLQLSNIGYNARIDRVEHDGTKSSWVKLLNEADHSHVAFDLPSVLIKKFEPQGVKS